MSKACQQNFAVLPSVRYAIGMETRRTIGAPSELIARALSCLRFSGFINRPRRAAICSTIA